MIKQSILLIILSFLFIGWSCGDDNTPVSPDSTSQTLFYCNFEPNDYSNHGWDYSDTTATRFVSYSRDVPYPTDFQSLKLQRDTVNGYVPAIVVKVVNSHPYSNKKYQIDYYSKGKGQILIEVSTSSGIRSSIIGIETPTWKMTYSPTLSCGASPETLKVTFKPSVSDTISYFFIDDLTIEAIP